MFMYVGFVVIDKGLGPIEALKDSKAITYGYKWDLFLLSVVLLLLNMAGFVCLIIGLFHHRSRFDDGRRLRVPSFESR